MRGVNRPGCAKTLREWRFRIRRRAGGEVLRSSRHVPADGGRSHTARSPGGGLAVNSVRAEYIAEFDQGALHGKYGAVRLWRCAVVLFQNLRDAVGPGRRLGRGRRVVAWRRLLIFPEELPERIGGDRSCDRLWRWCSCDGRRRCRGHGLRRGLRGLRSGRRLLRECRGVAKEWCRVARRLQLKCVDGYGGGNADQQGAGNPVRIIDDMFREPGDAGQRAETAGLRDGLPAAWFGDEEIVVATGESFTQFSSPSFRC